MTKIGEFFWTVGMPTDAHDGCLLEIISRSLKDLLQKVLPYPFALKPHRLQRFVHIPIAEDCGYMIALQMYHFQGVMSSIGSH